MALVVVAPLQSFAPANVELFSCVAAPLVVESMRINMGTRRISAHNCLNMVIRRIILTYVNCDKANVEPRARGGPPQNAVIKS
jgi:hypothetical protein